MPYRMNIQEVVQETYSDLDKGLSEQEAAARLRDQGKNELLKKKKETVFQMFLEQFQDPMVIILIIGAIVSVFLKEYIDASIILTVIILNAIIGVVQEFKAEKAIDALEKLSTPKAFVVREGFLKEIDSKELVVGDLVELEVGGYIPADMRLVSSVNLKVEESTLTGESEAVEKDAALVYDEEINISDQRNMVFMSTYVTYGKARGIVVRTGMSSEVGKIARMLDETKEDMTPLQVRLAHLSKILGIGSVGICIAMFVVAVLQGRDLFDMLLLSISLAVAEMCIRDRNMAKVKGIGSARDIKYGVVNFKTKSDSGKNTSYTEVGTGYTGYTNGYYAADGAFLGYASNGTKVKFMLSGVVGLVDADEVEILDYEDEDKVQSVNYYICKNGNIYHSITLNIRQPYYTSTAMVGKQQSYMKSNTVYYSYDGHYFYTTYQKMIDDYKANTRKNSINASQPYYNYYQYVSSRTKTSFTASDINVYVKDYLDDLYNTRDTKMYNMGKYFIDYQNTYGAYALSSFGVAVNESAFGTSSIALSKNNLFGHNAVDSDPGLANGYSSPQNSILDHDKYYVNLWYSTPKYSTYHGAFLGDKASGMNVSYASEDVYKRQGDHRHVLQGPGFFNNPDRPLDFQCMLCGNTASFMHYQAGSHC